MKTEKIAWSGCPVRYAAGIMADKWTFLLLRDSLLKGKRSYGEFLASEEHISTNILADRLTKLVEAGMFTRETYKTRGNKVLYFPTPKARALLPILLGLMTWSVRYDDATEASARFATAFKDDPMGTTKYYEDLIDEVNNRARNT